MIATETNNRIGEYLTPEDRLDLAVLVHGLYTFPMADKIDTQCTMDNFGTPFLQTQLTERDRVVLNQMRAQRASSADGVYA